MDGTSLLFWLGLITSAAMVLFAISRGARRAPERPDHYKSALSQLMQDDWDGALSSLRLAIQSGHTTPDIYVKLGDLLRRRGEHMAAFQIHQGLTVRQDLQPAMRAAVLRSLVEDYRALDRHAEALRTLESLAALGRDAGVLRELARESLHAGRHDAAVDHLRAAQALDPALGKPEVAAFLATAAERCLQRQETSEAKRLLQQALKEDAASPPALLLMGDVAALEGDHDSALYYWQKLAFAVPAEGPELFERLERVYFELGKFGDIERVYAQILEKRPRDLQTMLAAARLALKKGELPEAERLLRAALEFAPLSSAAFQMLSNLCLDEGRTREVRDLIAAHLEQHRDSRRFACAGCGQKSDLQSWYCSGCGRFGAFRLA